MGVTADPFWSIRASAGVALAAEHRPDLDGLRALAALSVVATHTIWHAVPGGRRGVDMFFVLSGFLISGIILRALRRANFRFTDFYSRRVRRIFPALILMILTVWIAGGLLLLPDAYERLGKGIAASAVFSWYVSAGLEANFWDLYLSYTDHGGTMLSMLWSLGVEEQFYLLWPLLLVVVWRLAKAKLATVALCIALAASVSFGLSIADAPGALAIVPWHGVCELSIGGLLACAQLAKLPRLDELRARLSQTRRIYLVITHPDFIGFVALAFLMTSIFGKPDPELFPGSSILAPTLGTVLFIAAGATSYVNRFLFASAPMMFIGLISYPLYLWHFPIVVFLDLFTIDQPVSPWAALAVVLPTSIALAWLTYRYVELPIRLHPGQSRIVGTLAVTMAACGLLGVATALGVIRPLTFYRGGDIARAVAEDWAPGSKNVTWTRFQDAPLVLGRGVPRVLFMGDSNMQQYFSRLERLYEEEPLRARPAIFTARFGCIPGIEQLGITKTAERRACDEYINTTLSIANDPNIDTVVIAACWYVYFSALDWPQFGGPAAFRPGTDAALDQLKGVLHELSSRGKKVYLVLNIPVGRAFDPRAQGGSGGLMQAQAIMRPPIDAHLIRDALDPLQARLRQVAKEGGALTIDPLASLCDAKNCRAISSNGAVMYHDMWHLRPSFVRTQIHFLDAILLQN